LIRDMSHGAWLIGTLVLGAVWAANAAPAETHIFGDPQILQWPPSRTYHVDNYKLNLRFDEPKGEIFADEVVTLRPFQPRFKTFYLDSSELAIEAVTLVPASGAPVALRFAAQGDRLWITLDREYEPANRLNIRIQYHGTPRTGLFFVNPDSNYPNRPQEVWTQGESEFNHYWFPCWDYPNDLATSETVTTVPEGQSVVSNGKLVNVVHSGGQVTYDWVESIPHSAYLTSLAIGPWHKFSDKYETTPVDYYVPDYVDEATARRTFHLTPDMLEFFSSATGVDYPYEQYAQTAVHNFFFGGQENVSATTVIEWALHDERADPDYPSTILVAHELGQHWFGDYVQGRDWANIWVNEGFATYLTALYTQHHEGNDAYRFEVYNDQLTEQAQDHDDYRRPIVDRHYTDPMQMLDEITHDKGAAVLDMLRYVLDGAEAASHPASQNEQLFRALHHYLTVHHAQSADTADLIEAIRTITGQELGWFFHEWVFMAGHPEYRIEASYDQAKKLERLTVMQTQGSEGPTPIFDMPIEFAFFGANGERKSVQVRDHLQRQEFDVPVDFAPQWVDFDPDDFIDKAVQFDKPVDALIAEAQKDPSMMSRLWAAQQLGAMSQGNTDVRVTALAWVLDGDPFYAVRAAAAASLGSIGTDRARVALLSALRQSDSRVRAAAVEALGHFAKDPRVYRAFVNALQSDVSYAVEAAAARELGKSGAAPAFEALAAEAARKPEVDVMDATLAGLGSLQDPRAVAVLLAQARPGVAERIRLSALTALKGQKQEALQGHAQELIDVVRPTLHDPFLLIQEAGEELVGAFELIQFRADIQTEARNAPTIMQREFAQKVLEQFHPQQ